MLLPVANNKILNGLLLFALPLLIIITWIVFINGHTGFDNNVFNALAPHLSGPGTNFMKGISFLGNHQFLIPANLLLIAYLISRKDNRGALAASVIALSSLGLMSLLKNLVARHRPAAPLVEGISNYSFPSGHAMMSMIFYGLLIGLVRQYEKRKVLRDIVALLLILLLLLIGFSRIYLRVHYTTDVIAGYCIGICWLWLCQYIIQKKYPSSGFIPEQ